MRNQPDFAVRPDANEVEKAVEAVIGKYSRLNVRLIIILSFAAGMWAARLQYQVSQILEHSEKAQQEVADRNRDWTAWRDTVEERLRNGTGDRFTGSDWNTAASIYNLKMPMIALPYMWEIKKERGTP
jgi:hypothetical protein